VTVTDWPRVLRGGKLFIKHGELASPGALVNQLSCLLEQNK